MAFKDWSTNIFSLVILLFYLSDVSLCMWPFFFDEKRLAILRLASKGSLCWHPYFNRFQVYKWRNWNFKKNAGGTEKREPLMLNLKTFLCQTGSRWKKPPLTSHIIRIQIGKDWARLGRYVYTCIPSNANYKSIMTFY